MSWRRSYRLTCIVPIRPGAFGLTRRAMTFGSTDASDLGEHRPQCQQGPVRAWSASDAGLCALLQNRAVLWSRSVPVCLCSHIRRVRAVVPADAAGSCCLGCRWQTAECQSRKAPEQKKRLGGCAGTKPTRDGFRSIYGISVLCSYGRLSSRISFPHRTLAGVSSLRVKLVPYPFSLNPAHLWSC